VDLAFDKEVGGYICHGCGMNFLRWDLWHGVETLALCRNKRNDEAFENLKLAISQFARHPVSFVEIRINPISDLIPA
jgi:hypothetical protein